MPIPTYVATSKRLSSWGELLHAWIESINRYCNHSTNDNPFWHGEQTSVAFLTGVAFRLPQWFSLTEFPSAKDELFNAYGRNDAWLTDLRSEYYIEAKQLWLELDQLDYTATIPTMMQAAEQAARMVRVEPLPESLPVNIHRVALVFICPRYVPSPSFASDVALDLVQSYLCSHEYDALAWTFPTQTYSYKSLRTNKLYPGVLLIANVIAW